MARMGGGDEYVDRLDRDVGREEEEGDADDPQRPPLSLGRVHVLELPDDDERGEDLYQRVEPEPASATEWAATAATSTITQRRYRRAPQPRAVGQDGEAAARKGG